MAELRESLKGLQSSATTDESAIRETELQEKAARSRLDQANSQLRHCLSSLEQAPELDPSKTEEGVRQTGAHMLQHESAKKLAKLQLEYDDLMLKFGSAHPKVLELKGMIEATRKRNNE